MKPNLELIESRIDLEVDSFILEALSMVKKWRQTSKNEEIANMSSIIIKMTAYISKLRLERAAAQMEMNEQRAKKNEALKKLEEIWKV
jgi:hypothetical protein